MSKKLTCICILCTILLAWAFPPQLHAQYIRTYGGPSAGINSFDGGIRQLRFNAMPGFSSQYDDYLQYAPAAVLLGLKAAGYESRTCWGRMVVSDAFSAAVMAGLVNGLKYTVRRPRPDGSSHNSFPSGHTATAFMIATMLHKEYGWKSPWFSFGAYTAASATALGRIMNDAAERADSILSWNNSTDASSNPEYASVKEAFESAESELN